MHTGLLCYSSRGVSYHMASLSHLKPHLLGSLVSFSFFSIFSPSLSHTFAFLHDEQVMSYHIIAGGLHVWSQTVVHGGLVCMTEGMVMHQHVWQQHAKCLCHFKASQMMHRWCHMLCSIADQQLCISAYLQFGADACMHICTEWSVPTFTHSM